MIFFVGFKKRKEKLSSRCKPKRDRQFLAFLYCNVLFFSSTSAREVKSKLQNKLQDQKHLYRSTTQQAAEFQSATRLRLQLVTHSAGRRRRQLTQKKLLSHSRFDRQSLIAHKMHLTMLVTLLDVTVADAEIRLLRAFWRKNRVGPALR